MITLFDYLNRWVNLVERYHTTGYDQLSGDEKVWFNIQVLTQSISNGGLISYYYNSGADHLQDCMQALKLLGQTNMVELISKTNDWFPNGVSPDQTERNVVINSWPDDKTTSNYFDPIEKAAQREVEIVEQVLVSFIREKGLANGPKLL